MPANPSLVTSITGGVTTGRVASAISSHTILNAIFKFPQSGTTKTAAYTLQQSDQSGMVVVSSTSSVPITVPVLEAGTPITILRYGTGAVTLAASGVTIRVPAGSTGTPRAQYSVITLWYRTTTEVILGGDLT
jgi:hypothetical protein